MPPSPRLLALARAGVFGTGALLASTAVAVAAGAQPHAAAPRAAVGAPPAGAPAVRPAPSADTAAAAPAPLFSLADALRAALDLSPALRAARQQVRAGRGAVAVAESPLDPVVRTTVANTTQSDLEFGAIAPADALAANPVINTRQRVLDYQVSVGRQFSNGLSIAPTLDVQQATVAGLPSAPANRATAGLNLTVPLARNRMGAALAAARRSAVAGFDAARADLRQAAVQASYDAAVAYWDYAAAGERLAAYRSSEQRARVLVDETAELVRADARPAADLRQFRGSLAGKRAQRITAEQAVAESRQRLGVVLGLPAEQIASLPPARLDAAPNASPNVVSNAKSDVAPDAPGDRAAAADERRAAAWARTVSAAALGRRPDILAAAARREAASQALAAANHDLRPRVDLTVGASYAGLTQGFGLNGFVSPLGRTLPGTNTVVQLQYELPARRLAARGRAEEAEAALEQARIGERDLARQVESAMGVAAAGVERGRRALAEAGDAVRLAREVVENEKQKFRLGVSTQIDVIYAEDGLVNAQLAEIGARRTYAGAVGTLRYVAGDLGAASMAVDPGAQGGPESAAATAAVSLAAVLARDPYPDAAPAAPPAAPAAAPPPAPPAVAPSTRAAPRRAP